MEKGIFLHFFFKDCSTHLMPSMNSKFYQLFSENQSYWFPIKTEFTWSKQNASKNNFHTRKRLSMFTLVWMIHRCSHMWKVRILCVNLVFSFWHPLEEASSNKFVSNIMLTFLPDKAELKGGVLWVLWILTQLQSTLNKTGWGFRKPGSSLVTAFPPGISGTVPPRQSSQDLLVYCLVLLAQG